MIRPFTCLCAALAGASGLYLYTEKHRTTLLDQQISQIVQQTGQSRERTSMLKAEWALLNQPDRLQKLSAQFLPSLHPLAPQQFVQLADAVAHLPPKEEPKAAPQPDTFAPATDDVAAPPPAPGTDAATGEVLASALPEKIAPTTTDDAADAPQAVLADAATTVRPIALPAPPVRLATGRPHTQPATIRMASARARIIDPTAPDVSADSRASDIPAETAPDAPKTVPEPAAPKPRPVAASTPAVLAQTHPHRPAPAPTQLAGLHRPAPVPARAPEVREALYTHRAATAPEVRTVAWHLQPAAPRAEPVAESYSSALGSGSHAALPPPVPYGG